MSTDTATPQTGRSPFWRGPRRLLGARVPLSLADRVAADARAAGTSVSEHLAALIERTHPEEPTDPQT